MKLVINLRTLLVLFLLLSMAAGNVALADDDEGDDGDHERALTAVEGGKARPLAEILESTRSHLDGELVGVDFERKNGRYVYEFKIISPSGRLREIYVDAMTAQILSGAED